MLVSTPACGVYERDFLVKTQQKSLRVELDIECGPKSGYDEK
jgi:hypothetical protein